MKCWWIIISLLLSSFCSGQRVKYNFNSDWKLWTGDDSMARNVQYDDGRWKKITLPRAWNEDEAFKKDIASLSTGIAWYRKTFSIPSAHKGQKIFIEFEGVRQAAEIFVNGEPVGLHENGVTAFGFDISSLIQFAPATNTIAVRTDNSWDYKEKSTGTKYQWIDKNFNANYGGIIKNVYLHCTPALYQTLPLFSNLGTTGTYIYASAIDIQKQSATIHAVAEIKNETAATQTAQLQVLIKDPAGKTIAQFTGAKESFAPGATNSIRAAAPVKGLRFWSWGYGYLYQVETSLLVNGKRTDVLSTRTGFRKTDFKEGMFFLNDRVLQLKGYAQRTSNEWPAIGNAVPAWMSDYSNQKMIESNANLVRWMHITPSKQDVESCDRSGLLQAMPAGDAEKDVEGTRWQQRLQVMRDAIIYNRNNPSIIFYECGNESISEGHMKEMKAIRDQYDPMGGRAIGSREMLDSKEAEYGGEMLYVNKSAKHPMWAMEYSRDEGLRKYWDDYSPPFHKDGDGPLYRGQPAKEYNRNQESHAIENVIRWYDFYQVRPGTGKRVSSGGVNIIFSESNTHYRGAENYRRSGEVDALRIPKENFFAHQVMWNGWVDIEKHGIHLIGHWNYADTVQKDVYVVSTADKVELQINGRFAGWGEKTNGFLFTFKNIKWEKGTISATGFDRQNRKICYTQKRSTGKAIALRMKLITALNSIRANGHDIALVEMEAVDDKGSRHPLDMSTVNFSLEGPGEWRGGMAQGPDNYILSKVLPLECGVNRIMVRTTSESGTIRIKATATGLQPATLSIPVKNYLSRNGLSGSLPGAELPLYLKRGPTPNTPSYTASRQSLTIINAQAGCNNDSVQSSYDDNELSDWVNDGQLETAWIAYHLDQPSRVDEVELKLNNFRTKQYYLEITVDGQVAFQGFTAKTLGYTRLVCSPRTGKEIKIRISAPPVSVNENGTELNGKKADDGVNRNDAGTKGTLSIIEAEFYSVLPVKK